MLVGRADSQEWAAVKKLCNAAKRLEPFFTQNVYLRVAQNCSMKHYIQPYISQIHIFNRIAEICSPQIDILGEWIDRICDYELSAKEDRFVVRPFVDEKLDNMKRRLRDLPDIMTSVAREEAEHSTAFEHCSVMCDFHQK